MIILLSYCHSQLVIDVKVGSHAYIATPTDSVGVGMINSFRIDSGY